MCNFTLNLLLLHDTVVASLFRRNNIPTTSVIIHHIVAIIRFSRGNRKIQDKVFEGEEQQVYKVFIQQ